MAPRAGKHMDDIPEPTNQPPEADEAGRRQRAALAGAILLISLAALLIATTTIGFGPYEDTARAARPPTLWDWLQLLIVPAVLALGAIWFNKTQKDTELKIADKARAEDRDIARQARESDQQIAADRLRQTTLEGYYDRMTALLLDKGLRESAEDSEARSIARARTVAVVKGLDGERKGQLLAFLKASGLIEKDNIIVDLQGMDFSELDLSKDDLREANLSGVDLQGANLRITQLSNSDLSYADLGGAILSGSTFSGANLRGVDLNRADLRWADLSRVNLAGCDLSGAKLDEALLSGVDMGQANLRGAYLHAANLSGVFLGQADLGRADLCRADLSWADLFEADLHEANLCGVELERANLTEAINWTIEQFDQVSSLAGATMPDGTRLRGEDNPDGPTYDEWKEKLGIKN